MRLFHLYTMRFIGFISFTLGILLLAHAVLYFQCSFFFRSFTRKHKLNIILLYILLCPAFPLFTFLVSRTNLEVIRIGYITASLWLGFLNNLVLGFILSFLIYGIFKMLKLKKTIKISGYLGLGAGLILSAYGMHNARFIQIQEYTIEIPLLPQSWEKHHIVQVTDLHLGAVVRQSFFHRVVDEIQDIAPDIIFMTGDIFDGTEKDILKDFQPASRLDPPLGKYFVCGNHEQYLGREYFADALEKFNITNLRNEIISIDGIQIIGWEYFHEGETDTAQQGKELLNELETHIPAILLSHAPIYIDEAKDSGVNLHLTGHTHRGQIFPFNFITSLVFRGYDYGLYQKDEYHLYVSSGVGTWGPRMRTSSPTEIIVFKLIPAGE